jgi:hypothetical protein
MKIPVRQFTGSWTFGKTGGEDYSTKYTESNPLKITIGSKKGDYITELVKTYYTYSNDLVKHDDLVIDFTSDWCNLSRNNKNTTDVELTFRATQDNSELQSRSVKIKITQKYSGKSFYIEVVQEAINLVSIYGGIKDISYVFSNSSTLTQEISSSKINNTMVTMLTGVGPDKLINTYDISQITYLDNSSGSIVFKKVDSSLKGKYLYVYQVITKNNVTTFKNVKDSYFTGSAKILVGGQTSTELKIQAFGTNLILFNDQTGSLGTGYEYILTNTNSTSGSWDTNAANFEKSSDYYVFDGDISIQGGGFTVDPIKGIGYLHMGSRISPSYTTTNSSDSFFYVMRRKKGSNSGWNLVGQVLWLPVMTDISISWY